MTGSWPVTSRAVVANGETGREIQKEELDSEILEYFTTDVLRPLTSLFFENILEKD